jgi:hypothetical protein
MRKLSLQMQTPVDGYVGRAGYGPSFELSRNVVFSKTPQAHQKLIPATEILS